MKIELNINGSFELEILALDGCSIGRKKQGKIIDKLTTGEYVFMLASRTICSIDDYYTPLHKVNIIPMDDVEYEFNKS